MGGAAPRRRDTSRENTAINSDGKRQGIAPGDEDHGPKDLDPLTTADDDSDHEAGASASSETDGPGDPGSSPDTPDQGNEANGQGSGSEEPPVTTQMPAIDAAPPAPEPAPEASPAAPEAGAEPPVTPPLAEEPAAAGPPAPGAPGAEPPVTTQMPKVDAPPPIPDPVVPSGERPAAFPSGERPAAYSSGEQPAAVPPLTTAGTTIASGERSAAYASGESPAAGGAGGERPRHMRSGAFEAETGEADGEGRREIPKVLALVVPGVVLALLIVAWAVDTATHSGQVLSNVELAGTSIDGTKEDELPGIVAGLAEDMAARKVTLTSGDLVYETTAGELGLKVDESATVDVAMDAGRGSAIFVRPFQWIGAFFSARQVDLDLTVTEATTSETLQRLQGADHTQPTEPSIELTAEGFQMQAGQAGVGIDPVDVATDLRRAAEASPEGAIEIDAEPQDRAPTFTDQQAQDLADRANEMTANGLSLKAGEAAPVAVPAATLRGWLSQTVTDGQLDLAFNADAANMALPRLMANVDQDAKNATVRMAANGQPEVVPHEQGVTCCGESSAELIWTGLSEGQAEVALEATVAEPEWTTEEVQGWGIVGPVGGNRGWQSGQDLTSGQPAGFTTYHGANETRNINIEKIADHVRGAVVAPGGEFSINDHVGTRTYARGYVDAGAISGGLHVQEVGGGTSQFATTMFNAAFFAGFDILEYQTHSEHFSRYPPGREATMGTPANGPDLRFRNTSPYGVLIWTSYTPTSITVTFYSSPHATGEQTGISEVRQGVCRVVTTTRTLTFPDGHTEQDSFKSQPYRPEGKRCDGSVIPPPTPPQGTPPPPTG